MCIRRFALRLDILRRLRGYRRIFNIKEKGTRHGGRIIFVDEGINLNEYVSFLETVPKRNHRKISNNKHSQ